MVITRLENLKKYEKNYKIVPVAKEILSDTVTPIEVMRRLKNVSERVFILESVVNQTYTGRYTFLGYAPKLSLMVRNNEVNINYLREDEADKENVTLDKADPMESINELMKKYTSPKLPNLPGFTGGLVGYFAFDFIKYQEPVLKLIPGDEKDTADAELMLFDKCIAFDNIKQKLILITNISTQNMAEGYAEALAELDEMENLILNGTKKIIPKGRLLSDFTPRLSKEEYCEMVEKGKHHIFEGDIFQVVLSNRMQAEYAGSLFDTYRQLRTSNPSPYMFYLDMDGTEIAGASPETLVKLDDGDLYTYPLAGTRPRGKTPEEDMALEAELLKDEKELAEHNMLVDLGRNDLGRISDFGTVEVVDYMSVLRYSHVMHIGSTVKGRISDKYSAIDAIGTVLPAGTLSGAPKIRACEIINDLEGCRRGIYGGAIGYIDFGGNMDTCIAIRFAAKKNDKVTIQSGAGIVADSVPEKEYQECLNKAQAVINAIKEANEM